MGAGLGLDYLGVLQERRLGGGGGEFRRELTEDQVLTSTLNQGERGCIPKGSGSAVAQDHLVPGREVEERRDPLPDPLHQLLHGGLAVARAQQAHPGLSQCLYG